MIARVTDKGVDYDWFICDERGLLKILDTGLHFEIRKRKDGHYALAVDKFSEEMYVIRRLVDNECRCEDCRRNL